MAVIEQDYRQIILDQKKGKSIKDWTGPMIDYLKKVKETPEIANFAPGRIFNMVMKHGITEVDPSLKIRGYEDLVEYNFFNSKRTTKEIIQLKIKHTRKCFNGIFYLIGSRR